MSRRFWLTVWLILTAIGTVQAADVSPNETAGAEEARFNDERNRLSQRKLSDSPPPVVDSADSAVSVPAGGKRFTLTDIRFTGNYSVPDSELNPFFSGLTGRPVTLDEVRAAVSKVRGYYRGQGFAAAYVSVPPQDVTEGTLHIDVLEGRLGQLFVRGNRHVSVDTIERQVRFREGEVLRYERIVAELNRLNRRDLKAKAVLSRGAQTGSSDLTIDVTDEAPVHVSVDANNSGTDNTGKERFGLSASHTNLFGRLDELAGRVSFGKDTSAAGLSYETPVQEEWGTRAGYSFSYSELEIKGPFTPLDLEGDATTHQIYLKQPLIEHARWSLGLRTGFKYKDVENRRLGTVSGKDNLRIFTVGADWEARDGAGRSASSHDFDFGVPEIFGGSDKVDAQATRQGSGGQFFVYRGTLTRLQKLWGELTALVRGAVQLTPDKLAPSEQFRLGGATTVRGYQEGAYLGDYGARVSVDVFVPIFPDEWKLPYAKESLRKQIQLIGFADIGTAGLKAPFAGEDKHKTLAGAGVGIRMHLFDKFYGRAEWGYPVGDTAIDSRGEKFYFSVAYEVM